MLPAPAEVRALVIGVERYHGLGQANNVRGAVAAAIDVARWLVGRGVDSSSIELWLAPAEGTDIDAPDSDPRITAIARHRFDWATFRAAMAIPGATFASGSGLVVYFSGHGVTDVTDGGQHLVLPEASEAQFRCFELLNWRALFASGQWARFNRQLWIVDACRNSWGIPPHSDRWQVGSVIAVERCLLSSCAEGETAAIVAEPRCTRELLTLLLADQATPWPDFVKAFDDIAVLLRTTGTSRQTPTVLLESPGRVIEFGAEHGIQALLRLLDGIDWEFTRYLPYIMRAQSIAPPGFARPSSLEEALERLDRLAPVDGIPPLVDFAARIADAAVSEVLREWVAISLTKRHAKALEDRRKHEPAVVTLSLWYCSEGDHPAIHGGLDIVDAGRGVQPWPRMPAKPVAPGRELEVIGEWAQAVYDHLGLHDFDLTVELFLSADLLATGRFDLAAVPLAGNDLLPLDKECVAVLRCADRYKGGRKLQLLRRVAPGILARHDGAPGRLHWAAAGDDPATVVQSFAGDDAGAPVWLGFDGAPENAATFLQAAMSSGLPAAIWLRAAPTVLTADQLRDRLCTLLAPALDALPRAMKAMRAEKDEAARTVAVLLDDPARIPAMFTRMRQPGE